jgi:hypothetical protein
MDKIIIIAPLECHTIVFGFMEERIKNGLQIYIRSSKYSCKFDIWKSDVMLSGYI